MVDIWLGAELGLSVSERGEWDLNFFPSSSPSVSSSKFKLPEIPGGKGRTVNKTGLKKKSLNQREF